MLRSTSEILEEFPVKKINGLSYYREDHVRVAMVKFRDEFIDNQKKISDFKKPKISSPLDLAISEYAKKSVSETFGVPISDIEGRLRTHEVSLAKFATRILVLSKGVTNASICRIFKIDHSTMNTTVKSHEVLMSDIYGDKTYQKQFKIAQEKFLNYVS